MTPEQHVPPTKVVQCRPASPQHVPVLPLQHLAWFTFSLFGRNGASGSDVMRAGANHGVASHATPSTNIDDPDSSGSAMEDHALPSSVIDTQNSWLRLDVLKRVVSSHCSLAKNANTIRTRKITGRNIRFRNHLKSCSALDDWKNYSQIFFMSFYFGQVESFKRNNMT